MSPVDPSVSVSPKPTSSFYEEVVEPEEPADSESPEVAVPLGPVEVAPVLVVWVALAEAVVSPLPAEPSPAASPLQARGARRAMQAQGYKCAK